MRPTSYQLLYPATMGIKPDFAFAVRARKRMVPETGFEPV